MLIRLPFEVMKIECSISGLAAPYMTHSLQPTLYMRRGRVGRKCSPYRSLTSYLHPSINTIRLLLILTLLLQNTSCLMILHMVVAGFYTADVNIPPALRVGRISSARR